MIHSFFQIAVVAGAIASGGGEGPAATGVDPQGSISVEIARYAGTAAEIEVNTPSVPSADIEVDGRLDDDAWEHAALLEGFTQFRPIEGSEASQKTEVLVLVDDDAIYFGIRAFDDEPGQIRATLSERDS
jgi:hypothetical protein